MVRHDVAQELAKPISLELLGSSIPARLAYVGTDDAPRVIPIAFQWTGEHVVMATVPKSAKVRALRQRPRVAITIDEDTGLIVDGAKVKHDMVIGRMLRDLNLPAIPDRAVEIVQRDTVRSSASSSVTSASPK